jgi:hypothetical protein
MSPAYDSFARKQHASASAVLAAALPPLAPPAAVKQALMQSLGLDGRFAEVTQAKGAYRLNGKASSGLKALAEGSLVEVAAQGRLELRIPGKAVIVLMQGAQARLRKVAAGYSLDLLKGAALAHIKTGTQFLATLPLGQVQVKGTYFYVKALGPQKSYLCLCEGWVQLTAPGLSKELRTDHDKAMELQLQKGRTVVKKALAAHPHPRMSGF